MQKYYQKNLSLMVFIQEIICLKQRMGHMYKSIGTHWIALCTNANNEGYFDSFGVENIPKQI